MLPLITCRNFSSFLRCLNICNTDRQYLAVLQNRLIIRSFFSIIQTQNYFHRSLLLSNIEDVTMPKRKAAASKNKKTEEGAVAEGVELPKIKNKKNDEKNVITESNGTKGKKTMKETVVELQRIPTTKGNKKGEPSVTDGSEVTTKKNKKPAKDLVTEDEEVVNILDTEIEEPNLPLRRGRAGKRIQNGSGSKAEPAEPQKKKTKVLKEQVEEEVDAKASDTIKEKPTKSKKKADKIVEEFVEDENSPEVTKKKPGKTKSKLEKVEEKSDEPKVIPEMTKAKAGKTKSKLEKVEEGSDELKVLPKITKAKAGNTKPKQENIEKESDEPKDMPETVKTKPGKTKSKPEKPKAKTEKIEQKPEKSDAVLKNQTVTNWDNITYDCKQTNAEGKEPTLRFTSWNVSGLRAWLKKDGLTIIQHDKPDIFCLQEVKCSENKLPEEVKTIEGYTTYWCNSKVEGYAGVALFSKIKPIDVKYGINNAEHDNEGRCITAEYNNFYLVNVYVPNAGRKLVTLPKRLGWNIAFKDYIKKLDKKKPVIICGDMNVAHSEIDLANPKTNTKSAGFTIEEREGMSDFLEQGYVDTFRSLYPDKKDSYTFWSYMNNARSKNVGWRLDYFIVSQRLVPKVLDNVIQNKVFGSDHCPITLFVNI